MGTEGQLPPGAADLMKWSSVSSVSPLCCKVSGVFARLHFGNFLFLLTKKLALLEWWHMQLLPALRS